jgi:hypothetical protein
MDLGDMEFLLSARRGDSCVAPSALQRKRKSDALRVVRKGFLQWQSLFFARMDAGAKAPPPKEKYRPLGTAEAVP